MNSLERVAYLEHKRRSLDKPHIGIRPAKLCPHCGGEITGRLYTLSFRGWQEFDKSLRRICRRARGLVARAR
jgi:hypothetical protein